MNRAGLGSCSQTCGKKVERRLPTEKITPSISGRNWARASASLMKAIGSGGVSNDTSTCVIDSSLASRGSKRGSRKAAARAFSCTSWRNGRQASRLPIQPRNWPGWVRVTKVAPGASSSGVWLSSTGWVGRPKRLAMALRARVSRQGPRSVMAPPSVKGEGRVADHAITVTGCVTGVAQTEQRWLQAAPASSEEQAVDWVGAAGLLGMNVGVQFQDVATGIAIDLLRRGIGQEMRQVGTDDNQRFRPIPQGVEHFGDFIRRGMADGERYQREIIEHALQEAQVHFQ